MVTAIQLVLLAMTILIIAIALFILSLPFLLLHFWLQKKRLLKNIPEKIKKEVENVRTKKETQRETAREKYNGIARRELARDAAEVARADRIFREASAAEELADRNQQPVGISEGAGSADERRDIPPEPSKIAGASKRSFKIHKPKFA